MDQYLLDQLTEYATSDAYPLHMPGHKRQMSFFEQPYSIDITEIDGFDNLHHTDPENGILHAAQQRAAALYGAEETYYLINGSTCGILAAVSAVLRRGERILMARNSHKSAYHAALLNGLHVTWLYPSMDERRGIYGSIRPELVREALAGQERPAGQRKTGASAQDSDRKAAVPIRAVLITSPTYDGVVSDIRAIAEEVHRAGAVLIVDEAHGAHFAMHPYFPDSALGCGADIVINSLHKTMPSLTQTALLHVKGPYVDRERLRKYLGIYQSSSPSYVLMAGMDECVRLMETRGKELFAEFVRRLTALRERLGRMKVLHLVTGDEPELAAFAFDRAKVLVSTECASAMPFCRAAATCVASADPDDGFGVNGNLETMNGPALAEILRKRYHLEVEMAAENYVTAIMTVADTQEGFDRLEAALLEMDGQLWEARHCGAKTGYGGATTKEDSEIAGGAEEGISGSIPGREPEERKTVLLPRPVESMTMAEADDSPQESVPVGQSPGRTAAEFVYLYPPGIPLLVPGERIPDELPELLTRYREEGLSVQGMADYSAQTIRCVAKSIVRGS